MHLNKAKVISGDRGILGIYEDKVVSQSYNHVRIDLNHNSEMVFSQQHSQHQGITVNNTSTCMYICMYACIFIDHHISFISK